VEEQHPPNEPDRIDRSDPIARVLKFAGSRPQPDPARMAEFKQALRNEWRRETAPRFQTRAFSWTAAAAAGIAAVLFLAWLLPSPVVQPTAAPQIVGRVARTEGVVSASRGDEVRADMPIETPENGRMALSLGAGLSLRIDASSRIVVIGERVVRLERGAIYVDASDKKSRPVLIHTPHGDVRDIGTQFEVRAERSSFRIRVREGEILVNDRRTETTARAGEALHVDAQGRYVRSAIPIFGPEWAWTSAIAPQFQLEGSTVPQFLDWVAREQGWRWRFADEETSRRAAGIVTHGSIEGYTPEEALSIVLPTCGLSFVRNRGEVVVSLVKEPSSRDE
jgi:hypothetical protein